MKELDEARQFNTFPQKSLVTGLLYQGEWLLAVLQRGFGALGPAAVLQRGFGALGPAVINAAASPAMTKRTALHTPALPLDATLAGKA